MFNGVALNMLFQIFIESEVAQFQNCHFFEYKTKKSDIFRIFVKIFYYEFKAIVFSILIAFLSYQ